MRPSEKNIKEIAENLECGMTCYFNVKTGEIKTIINTDSWDLTEEEAWEEDINEIEENQDAYIEFHGMSSHESFNLMVDFTDLIDDLKLKERLIRGLNRPKPFRNFKWEIDNSGEYRQQWFDFKSSRYISYVQDQIDLETFE